MRTLPSVPRWIADSAVGKYLIGLVDAINRELRGKPSLKDGVLYASSEEPLAIVGDDAASYFLAVESGKLIIKDSAGNEVFGANLAETDLANTFSGANVFTAIQNFTAMPTYSGDKFWEMGSNSNGSWIILFGAIQVCWVTRLTLPFEGASACSATWTLPRAFADANWFSMVSPTPVTAATSSSSYANQATPTVDEVGNFAVGSHTATTCFVRVVRTQTLDDFVAGDNMYANVLAIGTPS